MNEGINGKVSGKISETDLYDPVRLFFEELGYTVNSEVKKCDVTAYRDDELIVVELKTSFNLKLVYQVINRAAITTEVYACIPRPRTAYSTDYRNMLSLLRRLGIGLITVAVDSPMKTVDVLLYPEARGGTNKVRRGTVLKEIMGRSMDANIGGSTRVKINTAYRERSLKIACILELRGELSPAELVKEYGCDKDAGNILRYNPYGWFKRVSRGVYGLDLSGRRALEDKTFKKIVDFYRSDLINKIGSVEHEV